MLQSLPDLGYAKTYCIMPLPSVFNLFAGLAAAKIRTV